MAKLAVKKGSDGGKKKKCREAYGNVTGRAMFGVFEGVRGRVIWRELIG